MTITPAWIRERYRSPFLKRHFRNFDFQASRETSEFIGVSTNERTTTFDLGTSYTENARVDLVSPISQGRFKPRGRNHIFAPTLIYERNAIHSSLPLLFPSQKNSSIELTVGHHFIEKLDFNVNALLVFNRLHKKRVPIFAWAAQVFRLLRLSQLCDKLTADLIISMALVDSNENQALLFNNCGPATLQDICNHQRFDTIALPLCFDCFQNLVPSLSVYSGWNFQFDDDVDPDEKWKLQYRTVDPLWNWDIMSSHIAWACPLRKITTELSYGSSVGTPNNMLHLRCNVHQNLSMGLLFFLPEKIASRLSRIAVHSNYDVIADVSSETLRIPHQPCGIDGTWFCLTFSPAVSIDTFISGDMVEFDSLFCFLRVQISTIDLELRGNAEKIYRKDIEEINVYSRHVNIIHFSSGVCMYRFTW